MSPLSQPHRPVNRLDSVRLAVELKTNRLNSLIPASTISGVISMSVSGSAPVAFAMQAIGYQPRFAQLNA
jgi:hypothetical protein